MTYWLSRVRVGIMAEVILKSPAPRLGPMTPLLKGEYNVDINPHDAPNISSAYLYAVPR